MPLSSQRPLSDVARIAVGSFGAGLVAIGALISFYGYLSAKILGMPRVTFALAEQGDFPQAFAAIHPRFRTPYISILVFAALVLGFALIGEFKWNVTLSAVARLLYYGVCCAALPVLRRKHPASGCFRLPAGNFFAGLAVLMCAALVTRSRLRPVPDSAGHRRRGISELDASAKPTPLDRVVRADFEAVGA